MDAARTAPVLPAEMNASASPAFNRPRPTEMLDWGFLRTAESGFSSIAMTSGA